jgi:hypothetical protein
MFLKTKVFWTGGKRRRNFAKFAPKRALKFSKKSIYILLIIKVSVFLMDGKDTSISGKN